MPLAPDEIQGRKFSVNLRGYEKEEVDSFLTAVAADYKRALEGSGSNADPYGALGQEVGEVLRFARESAATIKADAEREAESLRSEANEDATKIREAAATEATATMDMAREKATRLRAEAEVRARDAEEETDSLRRRGVEEVADIRRRAAEEAAATLEASREKAVSLVHEAERHAQELADNAERKYHERLDDATARHAQLQAHEQELNDRVTEVGKALQRLLTQLRPGGLPLAEDVLDLSEDADARAAVSVQGAEAEDDGAATKEWDGPTAARP